MSRNSRSLPRTLLCLAFVALAGFALAACGDSEEEQALTFTLTEQGGEAKLSGPQSAETGLAEITLENETKGEGDMQLIRVEGDHSADEVVEGLGKAMQGQPFPDWLFAAGGVGALPAGESATVTQVLAPGTYYAANTEGGGPPKADALAAVEVTGDESDAEVGEGDGTVTAVDYDFEAEELPSGEVEVDFVNDGEEPHHLIAAPLKGDATAADVEQAIKTEKSEPPIEAKGIQGTAVIEGGEDQLVTLDLEPGRYALLCFISDRQGGPPHALKGMVAEVEVK
jgi:hypothetical protein